MSSRPLKLLAALALSPRTAAVAGEARRLAQALQAELTFLHVGQDTPETRSLLNEALQQAGVEGHMRSLDIRPGKVESVSCKRARELGSDLLILGALEKEGPLEYFVGSAARRIARNAPCSVLLLTEPRASPSPFQRLVVNVTEDDPSSAMLKLAIDLARREAVESFHVVREYELFGLHLAMADGVDSDEADAYKENVQADEELKLSDFLEQFDLQGLPLKRACLRGKEGWQAVEYAWEHGADLLLFPAPGRRLTFWDKFFQHGVEFALQSLPCALLLYRSGEGA
ncbi:MAG: universal stress protein [Planctomycetes bacterium]|nr:universal stress protein [Planctomycetota bacterium]